MLIPAIIVGLALSAGSMEPSPVDADTRALAELDRAYVEGWLQAGTPAQEAALLPLFTEDAVIMPGGGMAPRSGQDELKEFWFPEAAPPTNVLSFDHEIAGIEVSGDLGLVHGTSRLHFEYSGTEQRQTGNFMFAARELPDGSWKISRMIWNSRVIETE